MKEKRLTSEGHEATSQDWAIARLEGNGYINLLKNKTMKRESKSVRTSPTNSTMRVKVNDGGQSSRWQCDGLSQTSPKPKPCDLGQTGTIACDQVALS